MEAKGKPFYKVHFKAMQGWECSSVVEHWPSIHDSQVANNYNNQMQLFRVGSGAFSWSVLL
jgi:hypothetical protein